MIKLSTIILTLAALIGTGNCDICLLPPDSGSCPPPLTVVKEQIRFYYSAQNLKCAEMPYSGCGGNPNNFKTLDECKQKCGKKFNETELVKAIAAAHKKSQCWYGNRTYSDGDSIPGTAVDNPCSVGCRCEQGRHPRIECAQGECFALPPANCVLVRKPDACCDNTYCPGSGPKPLTCTYKGKKYVDGQPIPPDEDDFQCFSCQCNKNWKGKLTTVGGVCTEVNCLFALFYSDKLVNKCEPQFYYTSSKGKESCCPIDWKCNSNTA